MVENRRPYRNPALRDSPIKQHTDKSITSYIGGERNMNPCIASGATSHTSFIFDEKIDFLTHNNNSININNLNIVWILCSE